MELKEYTDIAFNNWHKPVGLVFSLILILLIDSTLLTVLDVNKYISLSTFSLSTILVISFWFYSNRIPKTKKGKIGFVVSFQCSDDKEYLKVREDFITTLKILLKKGVVGNTFHFIEIPRHFSDKFEDKDDVLELRIKTNAHFAILGRIRLRKINGKDTHFINLEGAVTHKPIPIEVSNKLSREFSELLPRNIKISSENDIFSFKFTSDWTECVAKYIIGIAAGCSHDLKYAMLLLKDVEAKLNTIDQNFPIFKTLKERLPKRFAEIHLAYARGYLEQWRIKQDKELIQEASKSISNIPSDLEPIYEVKLILGILAFLDGRNINSAINHTKECKIFNDPVWHFNLAFLLAYKGELSNAIKEYRKAMKHEMSPEIINQIEDFILWAIDTEPDKTQLYYCLGYFNWHIKGDLQTARNDFNLFLKNTDNNHFKKERDITKKWLNRLKE